MRITIHRDGSVVATIPRFLDVSYLEKFVAEKRDWIMEKVEKYLASPLKFVKNNSKRDYKKYKEEVRAVVIERLEFYNKYYGFKYNRISIRNQKSRWGSCSKRGNLNFNYKLYFMPEAIRDYVIVHELCHLKEFNHSKDFWNLVAETVPNHQEIKKSLKSR